MSEFKVVLSFCLMFIVLVPGTLAVDFAGKVIDASNAMAIEHVVVHPYAIQIDGNGNEKRIALKDKKTGLLAAKTDAKGNFELSLPAGHSRIMLSFHRPGKPAKTYGPHDISPLSGMEDAIINMAFDPASKDSASAARDRIRRISELQGLGDAGVDAILGYEDYLADAVSKHWSNPSFKGAELSSILKVFQHDSSMITVVGENVWTIDTDGKLKTANFDPQSIAPARWLEFQSKALNIPSDLRYWSSRYRLSATPDGPLLCALNDRGDGSVVQIASDGKVSIPFRLSDTTRVDTTEAKALTVTGRADGTIAIQSKIGTGQSLNLAVGNTPVAASCIDENGKRIAAITIDGSYKVWDIETPNETIKASETSTGRIGKMFPNTLAFDGTGKKLIVGTGLKTVENGLTSIDIATSTSQSVDMPTTVAKLMVGMGESAGRFLTMDQKGSSQIVWRAAPGENGWLTKLFTVSGISDFGVSSDGKETALKIQDKDELLHVKVDQILKDPAAIGELKEFGIQKQKFP